MIGSTAPTTAEAAFADELKAMQARIADLERASQRVSTGRRVATGPAFDSPTVGAAVLTVGATASTAMRSDRLYMARLELNDGYYGTTVADLFLVGVQEDGVDLGTVPVYITTANQYIPPGSLALAFTTTAGSHVYRARAARAAGTGALQFRGQLYIYDDGPA